MSVSIGTEAGRPGRHGGSAAQPAARASSSGSGLATTLRPGTAVVCAWGRAETRGERG